VITQWDKLQGAVARVQAVNSAVQASGNAIINILTSVAQLQQAITNNRIEALDAQMEAELEAAGVSEETTLEQAQREYDIAVATGSELEKEEKRRALEKAKIEERFARRRATLQYEGELQAWEMQKTLAIAQGALAAINAYSSAAAVPIIGFTIAPFAAAAALTASAIQYQAIVASKPQPPKFAEGGIVPGTSFTGDNVTARLNSGEMVLNQTQQSRLFEIANGAGSMGNITIYLGDEQIYKSLYNASKRGDLIIDARGVVTR
jgi:cation transport regulator ChaC